MDNLVILELGKLSFFLGGHHQTSITLTSAVLALSFRAAQLLVQRSSGIHANPSQRRNSCGCSQSYKLEELRAA
jgi:hypothetical protein